MNLEFNKKKERMPLGTHFVKSESGNKQNIIFDLFGSFSNL